MSPKTARKSTTAANPTKRRNVKSGTRHGPAEVADAHEKAKDFLTATEWESYLEAAREGRHGVRDAAIMLLIQRHGLRVSELTDLRMGDLLLEDGQVSIRRLKGSLSTLHPIEGDELRALKAWLRQRPERTGFDHVFLTERQHPFTRQGINYLCATIGQRAGLGHVYPHMLRHTCGHLLADQDTHPRIIQDYLGHRDPANTARYTRISAAKFRGLWRRKGKP